MINKYLIIGLRVIAVLAVSLLSLQWFQLEVIRPRLQAKLKKYSTPYHMDKVRRVVDGRTLELASGRLVTVIGSDPGAADFLKSLALEDRYIIVEPSLPGGEGAGWLRGYVFVPRDTGIVPAARSIFTPEYYMLEDEMRHRYPVFLNATVIKSGYAAAAGFPDGSKHGGLFRQLALEAQEAGRGIWAPAHPAGAKELPGFEAFAARAEQLVRQYYPDAKITQTPDGLQFSHETMEFTMHLPLKTGEWQAARPMQGPKRHGGIQGTAALREGKWMGAAMVPQSFDRFYFTSYLMAPYSAACDCHLVAHLDYPDTVDQSFVKAWSELINDFEKYLQ